jgi:hypothetical protein
MGVMGEIQRRARARNRELVLDACVTAALGVLFSLLTFGFVFWVAWLAGWMWGSRWRVGLVPWQLAAIVTGIFALASTVSAWRRVDPFAKLQPRGGGPGPRGVHERDPEAVACRPRPRSCWTRRWGGGRQRCGVPWRLRALQSAWPTT